MTTKVKPYIGKIVKNGNAYHLSIPAHIRKYMDLEKGDSLKVELTILDKKGKVKAQFEINSRDQRFSD